MDNISIITVNSKRLLKEFIKLPHKIYDGNPNWVPPLEIDIKGKLDRNKNPFFDHGDLELFLAEKNGEFVGRIASIVNDNHNYIHKDNIGFFGFFECVNDQAVADALFNVAKNWLLTNKKDAMRGPASPTSNDEYGLLIDGFDDPPRIMMSYNPPYYIDLMENYGFEKAKDLNAFQIENKKLLAQDKIVRGADIVRKRNKVSIRKLDMKNFKKELEIIKGIYNEAWSLNWGFVPMTDEEIDLMAKEFKPLIDPNLIIFANIDGKDVAFSLVIPDYNEILKDLGGKLFPFGIFKFLMKRNKIKWARVLTLGILPEFRKRGLDALLYYEIVKRAEARGILEGEASWILEDNEMMNKGVKMMDGSLYKKYRVYEINF